MIIPKINIVDLHPKLSIPHTKIGALNPPKTDPPITIDIAVALFFVIQEFTAVIDGVKPPTEKPKAIRKKDM